MKTLLLLAFIGLVPLVSAAEKQEETKKHALRYLGGNGEAVVRASVVKSYFWQTIKHDCKVCTHPIHDVITIFKVEESYSGKIPVSTEICCYHRRKVNKGLKAGDVYLFAMTVPVARVRHLDAGELVPVADISKRRR